MDYEKKYKDALERATIELNADTTQGTKNVLMTVFPELKDYEDDDEKIRKALIRFHKSTIDIDGIKGEDIIAWLEKQGEQRKQLIDKACDVLVNCIEDFMLRRMEIWDEECKKQTLENIRKTLEE